MLGSALTVTVEEMQSPLPSEGCAAAVVSRGYEDKPHPITTNELGPHTRDHSIRGAKVNGASQSGPSNDTLNEANSNKRSRVSGAILREKLF